MPALWSSTVEKHRREVTDAILDGAAELASEHGALAITMSDLAERAGIGRATLYKYFPDVESVLVAWHDRQIERHLDALEASVDPAATPGRRLRTAFAFHAQTLHSEHRGGSMLLHAPAFTASGGDHVDERTDALRGLLARWIAEAAAAGEARTDVPPVELAEFCFHALSAAPQMTSKAALQRLVSTVSESVLLPAQSDR